MTDPGDYTGVVAVAGQRGAVMGEADLAIGSRYVPGGAVVNWPRHRLLLSRAGNAYVRVAIRLPVRDATAGFRVYSRRALELANYGTVQTQGYGFQIDMTRRVARAGLVIVEVPITFTERARGVSKMDSTIVREALVNVSRWAAEDRLLGLREHSGVGQLQVANARVGSRRSCQPVNHDETSSRA